MHTAIPADMMLPMKKVRPGDGNAARVLRLGFVWAAVDVALLLCSDRHCHGELAGVRVLWKEKFVLFWH